VDPALAAQGVDEDVVGFDPFVLVAGEEALYASSGCWNNTQRPERWTLR